MAILGLVLSIVVFLTVIAMLALYIIMVVLKKYETANVVMFFFFLHLLVSVMLTSWSLVMINGGYDIIFSLRMDFTWMFVGAIPVLIVIEFLDFRLRKALPPQGKILERGARKFLPTIVSITYIALSLLFFFVCNYYHFIASIA